MNLKYSLNRISTSVLFLLIGASLLVLPARSASAQSITVTTPFAFCINNHAYPQGTYRFTPVSEWLISIRNVHGTHESFFEAHPETAGPRGSASRPVQKTGGLTFLTLHGIRSLQTVYVPSADASFDVIGPTLLHDDRTHRSAHPTTCPGAASTTTSEIATDH